MKTKVEINGYEIEIEEKNGLISVSATFEGEVVEEFQIETEEGQEGQEDVQGFDEFGQDEEEDFGQDDEEGQEDDEEGQDEDEDESQDEFEGKLESFQSFINKKK